MGGFDVAREERPEEFEHSRPMMAAVRIAT